MTHLDSIVKSKGSKKLLALDGGGIRGMLTIEVLAKIESELRVALGKDERFVLADFFDCIAGTSTGAILATCLSLGWPVNKVRTFYETRGEEMFDKASILSRFRHKYDDDNLADLLREELGDDDYGNSITLGSDKLKTLLALVMRNVTTDSPWPVSNNPYAMFNDQNRTDCNLNIPLWQLVRASTAAPTFFPPEVVKVGGQEFIFVDGGVTTYNNPAFQLFLMTTVEPYNINWDAGRNKMLLISVGTGTSPMANRDLKPEEMNLLFNASSIPSALMFAALNEQDFLCRVFGDCVNGAFLDQEIGDMVGKAGPVTPKLFTYARYNAELSRPGLDALGFDDIDPAAVMKMDSVEHVRDLQRIGQVVADQQVSVRHFNNFLA